MDKPALLVLEDGSTFHGRSIGIDGMSVGEVVFNTSMTGYQEILTDPSYCRQLVTLTCPHVGNVGVNPEDNESGRVFCSGLVIRNLPHRASNWRSRGGLERFLTDNQVVAIAGVDTRGLTRLIRSGGAQAGCIAAGEGLSADQALEQAARFPGLGGMDLARVVSVSEPYAWQGGSWTREAGHAQPRTGRFRVIAYDFGVKRNILRLLADRGCQVTVAPAHTPAAEVLSRNPHGVFLSNGPGDPAPCDYAISAIREIVDAGIPVFGICLGHQLLALAGGARVTKMKFGHHGANHPVQDLASGQVLITSQNHGFTVEESSLPEHTQVTHRSLFDGTVQGIRRTDRPAFSFQGHPEASPGPRDIAHLFDSFVDLMQAHGGRHA